MHKRIAAWNIRKGGGPGERCRRVIETLLAYDADLLIVSEFRSGEAGTAILGALTAAGYQTSHPLGSGSKSTVLIASRARVLSAAPLNDNLPDQRHLWRVALDWISVVGVYMPCGRLKHPYWNAVVSAASSLQAPSLFVGDFNTGTNVLDKDPHGTPFPGAEHIDRIASAGFVDLWRSRCRNGREYTYFSSGPRSGLRSGQRNGFRIDHAFGSPQLDAAVLECRYDHAPRISGLSDHSAMVLALVAEDRAGHIEGAASR